MRINRFLSQAGLGSRRAVESLVRAGRVRVNGVLAELTTTVKTEDTVEVDGRAVQPDVVSEVILFHKPRGVVTSLRRQGRDPCLSDVAAELLTGGRRFHVGRLDRDSSGLLLLTNDGDLGQRLQRPHSAVWKRYEVEVDGVLTAEDETAFRSGQLRLDGRRCAAARLKARGGGRYRIELQEGRNRQIRRMMEQLGFGVRVLHRTAVGPLELGELAPGQWRAATAGELAALRAALEKRD